jgi:hypothetical protein
MEESSPDEQREAALGIAAVGSEGLAGDALAAADVVVASYKRCSATASKLMRRLVATLRR